MGAGSDDDVLLEDDEVEGENEADEVETQEAGAADCNQQAASETQGAQRKKKRKKKPPPIRINLSNCKYEVLRIVQRQLGWKEVGDDEDWEIYWTDTSVSIERIMKLNKTQKINHFNGMLEICRKKSMARNLQKMQKRFPEHFTFFPVTFILPNDLNDFLADVRTKGKKQVYILKPDAGCQGRGIRLMQGGKEEQAVKILKEMDTQNVVAQHYLYQPYLIGGYKFDLRIYALVLSCDPLRVFIFEEGLVRFCTEKYSKPKASNLEVAFMHLTNYAVNKKNENFVANDNADSAESASKWSLQQLRDHINESGHNWGTVWVAIQDVIIKSLMSVQPILRNNYRSVLPPDNDGFSCFELLGYDVMLDKELRPWLIEVNHSPSFNVDSPLDLAIKSKLISDTIELARIDPKQILRVKKAEKKAAAGRLLEPLQKKKPPVGATAPGAGEREDDNDTPRKGGKMRSAEEYEAWRAEILAKREKYEAKHSGGFERIYPCSDPSRQALYDELLAGSTDVFNSTFTSKAKKVIDSLVEERKKKEEAESGQAKAGKVRAKAVRDRLAQMALGRRQQPPAAAKQPPAASSVLVRGLASGSHAGAPRLGLLGSLLSGRGPEHSGPGGLIAIAGTQPYSEQWGEDGDQVSMVHGAGASISGSQPNSRPISARSGADSFTFYRLSSSGQLMRAQAAAGGAASSSSMPPLEQHQPAAGCGMQPEPPAARHHHHHHPQQQQALLRRSGSDIGAAAAAALLPTMPPVPSTLSAFQQLLHYPGALPPHPFRERPISAASSASSTSAAGSAGRAAEHAAGPGDSGGSSRAAGPGGAPAALGAAGAGGPGGCSAPAAGLGFAASSPSATACDRPASGGLMPSSSHHSPGPGERGAPTAGLGGVHPCPASSPAPHCAFPALGPGPRPLGLGGPLPPVQPDAPAEPALPQQQQPGGAAARDSAGQQPQRAAGPGAAIIVSGHSSSGGLFYSTASSGSHLGHLVDKPYSSEAARGTCSAPQAPAAAAASPSQTAPSPPSASPVSPPGTGAPTAALAAGSPAAAGSSQAQQQQRRAGSPQVAVLDVQLDEGGWGMAPAGLPARSAPSAPAMLRPLSQGKPSYCARGSSAGPSHPLTPSRPTSQGLHASREGMEDGEAPGTPVRPISSSNSNAGGPGLRQSLLGPPPRGGGWQYAPRWPPSAQLGHGSAGTSPASLAAVLGMDRGQAQGFVIKPLLVSTPATKHSPGRSPPIMAQGGSSAASSVRGATLSAQKKVQPADAAAVLWNAEVGPNRQALSVQGRKVA